MTSFIVLSSLLISSSRRDAAFASALAEKTRKRGGSFGVKFPPGRTMNFFFSCGGKKEAGPEITELEGSLDAFPCKDGRDPKIEPFREIFDAYGRWWRMNSDEALDEELCLLRREGTWARF